MYHNIPDPFKTPAFTMLKRDILKAAEKKILLSYVMVGRREYGVYFVVNKTKDQGRNKPKKENY